MKEKMEGLKQEVICKLQDASDLKMLNELRTTYLGKKGPISALSSMMGSLSTEEKKEFGKALNDLKGEVNSLVEKRKEELLRLIQELPVLNPISVLEARWDPESFFAVSRGLEDCPEGGQRCFACYRLRLEKTAQFAQENGFDWFTTTLSISPLKNAAKINEIGEELARKYGVRHLPSDFKKKGGYQQSIVLSKEYHLYRQYYCGCIFSQREAAQKQRSTAKDE